MKTVLVASAPTMTGATVTRALHEGGIRSTASHVLGTTPLATAAVTTRASVIVCDLWTVDQTVIGEILQVRRTLPHVNVFAISVEADLTAWELRARTEGTRWLPRTALPLLAVLVRRSWQARSARVGFLRRKETILAERAPFRPDTTPIVTRSPAMETAFQSAERQISWQEPLLLCGEVGCGRETVARALHHRIHGPGGFQVLDGRGLTTRQFRQRFRTLDEPRTIYVPAVDDLSREIQNELVPIWSDTFHTQDHSSLILAATRPHWSEPLAAIASPWRVELPPLRARPEDIPVLARYFLLEAGVPPRQVPAVLTRRTVSRLLDYHFPGNVRELRALMIGMARNWDKPTSCRTGHVQRALRRAVSLN